MLHHPSPGRESARRHGIKVTQDQVYIRALAVDFFISLLNMVDSWAERTLDEIESWNDLAPTAEKDERGMETIRHRRSPSRSAPWRSCTGSSTPALATRGVIPECRLDGSATPSPVSPYRRSSPDGFRSVPGNASPPEAGTSSARTRGSISG